MKAVLVALLLTAVAAIALGATTLEEDVKHTLTPADSVPTKQQITVAFGSDDSTARDKLAELALDADPDPQNRVDIGIRLRAIHALAKYCGAPPTTPCATTDVAHQAIVQVIEATKMDTLGAKVLVLRAAIETMGTMRIASDVSTLMPLLDHPSRDIRAATARALRDLCNTQAITPLRTRYSGETTDQVKLAISEALRILGQCTTNP